MPDHYLKNHDTAYRHLNVKAEIKVEWLPCHHVRWSSTTTLPGSKTSRKQTQIDSYMMNAQRIMILPTDTSVLRQK